MKRISTTRSMYTGSQQLPTMLAYQILFPIQLSLSKRLFSPTQRPLPRTETVRMMILKCSDNLQQPWNSRSLIDGANYYLLRTTSAKAGTGRIRERECRKAPTCSELSLQITLAEPQRS